MKKILFVTLTLIFTQVALGFVNNELNENPEIKIHEGSEIESHCFPSTDKENPCENPIILGGEGGTNPPKSKDKRDKGDYGIYFLSDGSEDYGFEGDSELVVIHLKHEITRLVRENEGIFDVSFLLSELGKKYPHFNLTEKNILEIYEQDSYSLFSFDFSKPFNLVSGGRNDVSGGEGGN